jgi:maltose alpha-D-glucosyltransferase/alpha-amylase
VKSLNVNDPLWYKDAIIYELHVRAFQDSSGDGMGDFAGLAQRLDYLQDLGVTALWVLPFCPSPWRDDGYDIADYNDVHPAYGTLRDFHSFLREAKRRGLRVIAELVANHTSDQHEWFQRSRRAAPGSKWRDFYVWSSTPEKYKEARIIFKDFEASNWTWDPVAKAYYWHRFYSHQPDLNFDNPAVRKAITDAMDFWFDMGVDGLRLDAIPYLFERDDTNCENLPETHAFLKDLRRHMDAKYEDKMVIAEANQWPEDSVAYFGAGDECHMAFHFPVMPRLFMAIRMEDRYPIIEILGLTPPIPENCQWAMFLRNHDELTLEMVTDEERDYMYRVYAQDKQMRINLGIRRRLAPLLGNDRRKIELMNGLLFSLPGTPVLYYGDEIGMGDNFYLGDRNGVRTPMQWSADRNAGFSRANPQRLYLPVIIDPEYHYETVNVEGQQTSPHSLLWWTKRLIATRKLYKAFGRGSIEFLSPENRRVLAFVRKYEGEIILVVANLSRFPQYVELDLTAYKGMIPVELSGRTEFAPVGDAPYVLTLGSHTFYWFALEPQRERAEVFAPKTGEVPALTVPTFEDVLAGPARAAIGRMLPGLLRGRRWFRGKARRMRAVEMIERIAIPNLTASLVFVRVDYSDGDPEIYVLPVMIATGEKAVAVQLQTPDALVLRLRTPDGQEAIVYGALWDKSFNSALLEAIARRRKFKGRHGEVVPTRTKAFRRVWGESRPNLDPLVGRAEQSNSSTIFGDRFIMKLFRKLEPGVNPDVEIGAFLTETVKFPHTPATAGALEYRPTEGEPMTLAILQQFVPNEGDAWGYSMDELSRYFERAMARVGAAQLAPVDERHPLELARTDAPDLARDLIGGYLADVRLLGRRTAEMHLALVSESDDPVFAPEPFTDFYRHGLHHGMIAQAGRSLQLLKSRRHTLSSEAQEDAKHVLEHEDELRRFFMPIRERRISALRIRHHGDYHLGQVLYTGKDFLIIDFEGEPGRPLSERRIKRSALRDVAGMLRSFQYAAYAVLFGQVAGVVPRAEDAVALQGWAGFWTRWVSSAFLHEYLAAAGKARFLPGNDGELRVLLDAYLLEKAFYEVAYELNNRPDWVRIPLRGIVHLLEASA